MNAATWLAAAYGLRSVGLYLACLGFSTLAALILSKETRATNLETMEPMWPPPHQSDLALGARPDIALRLQLLALRSIDAFFGRLSLSPSVAFEPTLTSMGAETR